MDARVKRVAAGTVALAALAGAGWWSVAGRTAAPSAANGPVATAPIPAPAQTSEPGEVASVDAPGQATPDTGGTPMAQRVAVIGLLNKRNGASRDLTLHPGQAVRVGDVVVRLRACEQTAPYEQEQLTGAFVQLDTQGFDHRWRRNFSGWLYKERPALNVVQHPVYDVWTKSCTMSFPATGPDTTVVTSPSGDGEATTRSSRKKSPAAAGDAPAPTAPASAPPSNDT